MSSYCLAGRILKIDLSDRRMKTLKTEEFEGGLWGGRGLNQSLLLEHQKEGISPFVPDSCIVFGAGRLVNSGAPGAVRMNIDAKNVFTGGIGSSNVGGRFASGLKSAGFDHIIISGRSDKPVYLWIQEGEAEIRDAGSFWGRLVSETEEILKRETRDRNIQCLAIGPAGENSVWVSAIIGSRSRAAARCGLGAIMGDKRLKAIVVSGRPRKFETSIARPNEFSDLVRGLTKRLASLPSVRAKRRFGTVAAIPALNQVAAMPVRNYADECLSEDELSHYLPEQFERMWVRTQTSCIPCVINCQHLYQGAREARVKCDKLEANTVWDFGPRIGLNRAEDLLTCHHLCTEYGLDIDGTASVICWALDCFEKGLLHASDTDGLVLRWGDAQVVFDLIKKLALREGLGELLHRGSLEAARSRGRGSERLSFNIKGQDLIEPIRSCKGWALGVVVSPRGGTHTRGAPQTEFRGVEPETGKRIWDVETAGEPGRYDGKARLVVYYERLHAAMDSLGLCHFVTNWSSPDLLSPQEVSKLCSAALGEDISEQVLMERGERILTLEKIFNLIHTDFDRKDDYPPSYFMEEPIKTGPLVGEKLDMERWDKMLDEYYGLHDWDPITGFPRKQGLRRLGLEKYVRSLENKSKIS